MQNLDIEENFPHTLHTQRVAFPHKLQVFESETKPCITTQLIHHQFSSLSQQQFCMTMKKVHPHSLLGLFILLRRAKTGGNVDLVHKGKCPVKVEICWGSEIPGKSRLLSVLVLSLPPPHSPRNTSLAESELNSSDNQSFLPSDVAGNLGVLGDVGLDLDSEHQHHQKKNLLYDFSSLGFPSCSLCRYTKYSSTKLWWSFIFLPQFYPQTRVVLSLALSP